MFRAIQTMCLIVVLTTAARGEIVHDLFFRLPDFDAFDHAIMVTPSSNLDAKIIFRETVTGDTSPIMGSMGLGGAAFRLTAEGGDGRFTLLERPTFQAPFNFQDDVTIGGANLFGSVVPINTVSDGVFEAELGTVQLTAPTGGETLFAFVDPRPNQDNFAGIGSGMTIDNSGIRFGSLSVSAVPEPGSVIALSTLAVGGMVFHRRRRMARATN